MGSMSLTIKNRWGHAAPSVSLFHGSYATSWVNRAKVTALCCEQSLPRIRNSDKFEAHHHCRADQIVTIPGLDAHRVVADLAAPTSLGVHLPARSSSPFHPWSIYRREIGEGRG